MVSAFVLPIPLQRHRGYPLINPCHVGHSVLFAPKYPSIVRCQQQSDSSPTEDIVSTSEPSPSLSIDDKNETMATSPTLVDSSTTEASTTSETPDSTDSSPSLPALYESWFPPSHELANQARAAIDLAFAAGHRKMELQWPCVPNLEEIAAGTLLNFEFGKHVASDFNMDNSADYAVLRRYLASFCNLYWAKQIAQAECFKDRVVWAVSTDPISKERAVGSLANVQLASMKRGWGLGRGKDAQQIDKDDVVVVMDPRATDIWIRGCKMLPQGGDGVVVFLNSQFNETYGLTGPKRGVLKGTEPVYFLKRVTRGYVYRSFPGPWKAYLENPDMSVEVVGEFEGLPKLGEVAKVVREESNNRYGGFYNDRYVRGFGGRL